jgi:hypothetical protein
MTQADSVHSTPPINTPKINQTRRGLLAAGASAMLCGVMVSDPAVSEAYARWISPKAADDPAFVLIAE